MGWLVATVLLVGGLTQGAAADGVSLVQGANFQQRLTSVHNGDGEFWIGWSIDRWASPDQFSQVAGHSGYWSWNGGWGSGHGQLNGRPLSLMLPRDASQPGPDLPPGSMASRWELRPLAVLVKMDGKRLQRVWVSDFQIPVNLGKLPLLWLGRATSDASVAVLEGALTDRPGHWLKQQVSLAISQHTGGAAYTFLRRLLNSQEHADIREYGALGLGRQASPDVLQQLRNAIFTDPSQDVREASVRALAWQPGDATRTLLTGLASGNLKSSVQAQGLKLLADQGGSDAAAIVSGVIWNSEPDPIRMEAAEVVSRLPEAEGFPIATKAALEHSDAGVREAAVEALGDMKSLRALPILQRVASQDPAYRVQDSALEALAELPQAAGLAAVAKVAHTHPDPRLRAEAIEALGDMGEQAPRAREALLRLIGS